MTKLREFHGMHLQVEHRFDIWEQIGSAIAEVNDVNQLSETSVPESTIQTGVNDETQP